MILGDLLFGLLVTFVVSFTLSLLKLLYFNSDDNYSYMEQVRELEEQFRQEDILEDIYEDFDKDYIALTLDDETFFLLYRGDYLGSATSSEWYELFRDPYEYYS